MGYHTTYLHSGPLSAQLPNPRVQREEELAKWILEDQENSHDPCPVLCYKKSLVHWRDSLISRLRHSKFPLPRVIQIPRCLQQLLQLQTQNVWIEDDWSVWTIINSDNPEDIIRGRELVPALTQ